MCGTVFGNLMHMTVLLTHFFPDTGPSVVENTH